jgi:hypothetical protein
MFGAVSLILVATGLSQRETSGDTVALATPTPVPPTPTPTVVPTPVAVTREGAFVVEAASEPGAFERPTSFTFGEDGELNVGFEAGIRTARDLDGDGFYEDVSHFGYDAG